MLLDPLDAKLLRLLRDDARLSFRDLAERAGSTVPTVSARVKAMEDIGLIRGYRAQIDLTLTGGSLVLATLQARPSEARNVSEKLAIVPGVEDIVLLTGGNIHARIRLQPPERTAQEIHDVLAGLEGVVSYELREILAAPVIAEEMDVPERVDIKCHQCKGPIHEAPLRKAFGGRMHVFCCRHCLAAFAARYADLGAKAAKAPAPASRAHHHHH